MNGGRRPNQGRGTADQNEPGRGKHPLHYKTNSRLIISLELVVGVSA